VWAIQEDSQENLLTHWNGRRWSTHRAVGAQSLASIATDSRKRVWAVGSRYTGPPGQPGTHAAPYALPRWVTVREPKLRSGVSLTQVAMRGSSVWVVGRNTQGTQELIFHSYGRHLSKVRTRQRGNDGDRNLSGISAGPKKAALAIGTFATGTTCQSVRYRGLILVVHGRSTHRIDPTVTGRNSCAPPPTP
jgi:hypothetical protein